MLIARRQCLDHDYLPTAWNGPHVGLRLVEAFATLAQIPLQFGPRHYQSPWPLYAYEFEDLVAQRQAAEEDLQKAANAVNRVRLVPSAEQLGRMEIALIWPARYLRGRPLVMRVVGRMALLRARDLDIDAIAKRMRRSAHRLRIVNRIGLDAIASGLRLDRVAIF
jgi:hypothetical protein